MYNPDYTHPIEDGRNPVKNACLNKIIYLLRKTDWLIYLELHDKIS